MFATIAIDQGILLEIADLEEDQIVDSEQGPVINATNVEESGIFQEIVLMEEEDETDQEAMREEERDLQVLTRWRDEKEEDELLQAQKAIQEEKVEDFEEEDHTLQEAIRSKEDHQEASHLQESQTKMEEGKEASVQVQEEGSQRRLIREIQEETQSARPRQ